MPSTPAHGSGFKPMDGGWGWVVVVGAHISIGFAYSMPKVLSIFFKEIQEDLGASSSEIALISSVMLAAMYGGGPLSSLLVNRFGSRSVVIFGGLMCGLSVAAASFADSIIYLYFFIGIIGGCGLSFNLNAAVTIISKYFLVKRPLANGIAMAGSPVFLSCLAPLNQYLQDQFGWRGSLLILGGLILNCCVAGALMRPVIQPCKTSSDALQDKTEQPERSNSNPVLSCFENAKIMLDMSIFKDRGFVIYLIGSVMFIFGAYAPFVFLTNYAISKGVDEYSAAYLFSVVGFVDMFIRPATGLLANTKWIRPRIQYFYSLAIILNGVCHLLCPLMRGYAFLVAYAVFFGVTFGMVFALVFECLMDLIGYQRFPSAVGMVTIIECFPILVGPPAAGFLVDFFHDYKYLFIMCGSVILCGGLFLAIMNTYNYRMLKKQGTAKDSERNETNTENQDKVQLQTIETVMEKVDSETKQEVETLNSPVPDETETPKQM